MAEASENTVAFELVSPARLLLSEDVEMVVVPGSEGDFGVLPKHAPLISTLRPGVVKIYEGGQPTHSYFVEGGFAEVTPARCTVLADSAVPVKEIDKAEAEARLERARKELEEAKEAAERSKARKEIEIAEQMLHWFSSGN